MKDILDDDEWQLQPLTILLQAGAAVLSMMIVYNALAKQPVVGHGLPVVENDGTGNTVVLKYNPTIEQAQRTMTDLGIYKGPIDGVNGLRTQQAVQMFQQMIGISSDGHITDDLVNRMRFTKQVQDAAKFTGSVTGAADPAKLMPPVAAAMPDVPIVPVVPAVAASPAAVPPANVSQRPGTAASASDAPAKVTPAKPPKLTKAQKAAAAAPPAVKPSEIPNVKKVQIALAGLGYAISRLDGTINQETRVAILKYEMDNGLDMSGVIDAALMKALKVD